MKLNYNVTGADRKQLVGAISQELNSPMKYLGMPTAAYEIADPNGMGTYTISKTGEVTGPDNEDLVKTLKDYGFTAVSEELGDAEAQATETEDAAEVADETETHEVPDTEDSENGTEAETPKPNKRGIMDILVDELNAHAEEGTHWERLHSTPMVEYGDGRWRNIDGTFANMVQYGGDYEGAADEQGSEVTEVAAEAQEGKAAETQAPNETEGEAADATETEAETTTDTNIDNLTIEVPAMTPDKIENLCRMVEAKAPLIMAALGAEDLPIQLDGDKLKFPWFRGNLDAEHVEAYSTFISLLCKTAKAKSRVTAKAKEGEGSSKYRMRCFLLSLGMIGAEYKVARRILLEKLDGSSAFGSTEAEEAWKKNRLGGNGSDVIATDTNIDIIADTNSGIATETNNEDWLTQGGSVQQTAEALAEATADNEGVQTND